VVARNMMGGTALEVDRSDLMALVQDKRLHLPRT
jgi:TfoX/Sxy family transcriptional regulator of competence genes